MSKEKLAFNLIVDEDRCKVMVALLSAVHSDDKLFKEITHFFIENGLAESFESFLEEFSEKMHEHDWCQDPECAYEKD